MDAEGVHSGSWSIDCLGVVSSLTTSSAFVKEIVYHVILCWIICLEIILVEVWNGFLRLLLCVISRLRLGIRIVRLLLATKIKEAILICITLSIILLGTKRSEIHV